MNKYKKLVMNTGVFAIGAFGSKVLLLLLNRLYSKYLPQDESGLKSLIDTMILFVQPVFTFALQEYLIRFGLDKNYDKKQVFSTSAIITAAGMAVMALFTPLLSMIPAFSFLKGYNLLFIVIVTASSLRMLCQNFVRSRELVKLFALDGILASLTIVIFNVIFVAKLHMSVTGYMLAVCCSDLCSSIFLFIMAKLHEFFSIRSFSKDVAYAMMRFALPLIPTIVMWASTSLSDRLFIANMHSDNYTLGRGAAGLYMYAAIVPNLLSIVSTIFFQAWNISAITENDSADRSEFYEKVYSAYEAILFIGGAGLLLFDKFLAAMVIDYSENPEYKVAFLYTPILIVASVFLCLDQFLGSIYSATKHSQNSMWTAFVAGGVNLVLNYFFIPAWGIQGAALATFMSYFLCFWVRIIDARYYVPFRFNGLKPLINTAVLIVMSLLIIYQIKLYPLWNALLLGAVIAYNYKALLITVMKLLKREEN